VKNTKYETEWSGTTTLSWEWPIDYQSHIVHYECYFHTNPVIFIFSVILTFWRLWEQVYHMVMISYTMALIRYPTRSSEKNESLTFPWYDIDRVENETIMGTHTQTARWSHNIHIISHPIRYCSNISTEPLPSKDRGIFTEPSCCLA
jgi:hypothetical protein